MRISNVKEIYDNGKFVTIVTENSAIHLPMDGTHHLTIESMGDSPADNYVFNVVIDLYVE